jgi:hypothetical protein
MPIASQFVDNPIVHSICASLPKLDAVGDDSVPTPVVWQGDQFAFMFGFDRRSPLFEIVTRF